MPALPPPTPTTATPADATTHLSPAPAAATACAALSRAVRKRKVTVVLARREGHHAVGVRRGLQRTEAFHVRDVEHVQGGLEANRHPPAVELDGQHGRQEVDLADGVIFLRVPEAQPARAARARSCSRAGRGRIDRRGGENRCREPKSRYASSLKCVLSSYHEPISTQRHRYTQCPPRFLFILKRYKSMWSQTARQITPK